MVQMRKFTEQKLLIASHNQGKIKEIEALLLPLGIHCESSRSLNLIEPKEIGDNYLENALIKAEACVKATNCVALADDSGIELDAFDQRPGLHTAEYTDACGGINNVFREWASWPKLKDNPRAHFVCVLALLWPDGHYESFQAKVSGNVSFPPRGNNGHGYDPIFIPDGHTKTAAEMDFHEKNQCSHRFLAIKKLTDWIKGSNL